MYIVVCVAALQSQECVQVTQPCREEELKDSNSSCYTIIDETVAWIEKVNVHFSYIWFKLDIGVKKKCW